MAKRSHQDWADLIKQQSASGLTITAFCRQHKFSISTFYARKANKAKTKTVMPFAKATLAPPTVVTPQTQLCDAQPKRQQKRQNRKDRTAISFVFSVIPY